MPLRNIATIAVAVFLGLIAVLLVRNYLDTTPQVGTAGLNNVATSPVVVAAQAVPRGAVLQAGSLKVVNFPQDSVPAGAFQNIGQLTGTKESQRMALRSLVPNEPILPGKISAPGSNLNLAVVIGDGMRAVSLHSDEVAGVGGFVVPGDRVDVLLTRVIGSDETNKVTQAIAENVRVLGVDQSSNDEADKPVVSKAITVEVTPDQAQAISLGQSVGTVALALRHVADGAPLTRKTTAVAELGFDVPRKPIIPATGRVTREVDLKPSAPVPAQSEVRVTRGVDTLLYRGADTSLQPVGSITGGAQVPPSVGARAP